MRLCRARLSDFRRPQGRQLDHGRVRGLNLSAVTLVPSGPRGGSGGVGRSARRLYHCLGISFSSKRIFVYFSVSGGRMHELRSPQVGGTEHISSRAPPSQRESATARGARPGHKSCPPPRQATIIWSAGWRESNGFPARPSGIRTMCMISRSRIADDCMDAPQGGCARPRRARPASEGR